MSDMKAEFGSCSGWSFSSWLSGRVDAVTEPDEADRAANETAIAARNRLRAELLTSGLYDLVPLAEIESVITRDPLAATTADQQELALSVMRSLVDDGLMEFEGWDNLPLDEAMARVRDLFISNYDDPGAWAFAVWLRLTESGKRIAEHLKAEPTE